MSQRLSIIITACCLLLVAAVLGCEVEEEPISPAPEEIEDRDPADVVEGFTIDQPRMRVAPEGGTTAAYMTLRNAEADPDTLRTARSDAAQAVEIHESYEREDGTVGMREVDAVPIPAHTDVIFEPGGYHLMLLDLTRSLQAGASIDVELDFAERGAETYTFTVVDVEMGPATENPQ